MIKNDDKKIIESLIKEKKINFFLINALLTFPIVYFSFFN